MSPSNFGQGLRRACTAWRRRHPSSEAGRGRGGFPEFARGQQRGGPPPPGRRAFKPRVGSVVRCPAMISSFRKSCRRGRGCHVPGSAPCAAPGDGPGRVRGHRRSQRRAEGKGWQPERGLGCQNRAGGIAPPRLPVSGGCPPAHPHLPSPKGGRPECGAGSQLRGRMQAVARRTGAAVPSRGPRPGGTPFPACAPPRSARSRRRGRGRPARARAGQRATRVGDSGGRGARRRAGRSPPLLPRSKPSAPPPAPEKRCTFHRLLHHLVVAIHGGWGPCPARGRAAASRPSGCSRRLSERWG